MKKLIFAMLVLVAAFSACKKEGTSTPATEEAISVSSLPLKVTDYVANNYPAETIISALKVSNGNVTFIVSLNTLEELAFDDYGEFVGNGEDYHHHDGDSLGHHDDDILGHHDDDSLGHHEGDSLGHHGGNGHHGGHGGHGNHGEHGNSISLESLPSVITDYISANYAVYTLKHAEIDTLCQFGGIYEIIIEQHGVSHLKLFFDISGVFLASAERARYSDAPQLVRDYITANYSTYTVREKMEIITLEAGSLQYSVFLAAEGSRKSVIINEDGTFVCEK